MIPYIILYLFLLVVYLTSRYIPSKKNLLFNLSAIYIWLFIALRSLDVGTDTIPYYNFYSDPHLNYLGVETDMGFKIIGEIMRYIGIDREWFIFSISSLYFFGLYYIISRISKDKLLSIILFTTVGITSIFFFRYLSMVRQATSLSIYFIATYLLFTHKKTNIIFAIALLLLSVMVHGSTLFVLPFLGLLYFYRVSKKVILYIAILSTYVFAALNIISVGDIIQYLFGNFGALLTKDYSNYADIDFGQLKQSGFFNMNLLPFIILGLSVIYYSRNEYHAKWYVQLFLLSVVLNNIFYDNAMWSRLILPFSMFVIIAIPNLLVQIRLNMINVLIFSIVYSYFIYKVAMILIGQLSPNAIGNIFVPYETFF